jgi:hypothetical protein
MQCNPIVVRGILGIVCSLSGMVVSAQDKQLGDYTIKYGYTYSTASGRSVLDGGTGASQKLPGTFKFWFSSSLDMFVRSNTIKSSHSSGSWVTGAGDTVVGVDLVLFPEPTTGKKPEVDFTYDAKLPTSGGFKVGEVDHEVVAAISKTSGKHVPEIDLGDYIEGFSGRSAAHSFELTLLDTVKLSQNWKIVPELDWTTASPDTPSEVYQVITFKRTFKKNFVFAPGFRVTSTPYTGRFSAFVSLTYGGSLRKH